MKERESVDTNGVQDRTMMLGFDKEPNLFDTRQPTGNTVNIIYLRNLKRHIRS